MGEGGGEWRRWVGGLLYKLGCENGYFKILVWGLSVWVTQVFGIVSRID